MEEEREWRAERGEVEEAVVVEERKEEVVEEEGWGWGWGWVQCRLLEGLFGRRRL